MNKATEMVQKVHKIVRHILRICVINLAVGVLWFAHNLFTTDATPSSLIRLCASFAYIMVFQLVYDKFDNARHNIESGRWKGC